jgi:FKBP-type peptidyl-prolyl cis-trans isomerase FkpA
MNVRILSVLVFVTGLLAAGCNQTAEPPPEEKQSLTEDQKAIYAFGAAIGRQVGQQTKQIKLTPEELEVFKSGLDDALAEKTLVVEIEQYAENFRRLAEGRLQADAAQKRQQDEAFLAQAAQEPGAVKTDSGLVYRTVTAGKGDKPKATDTVRVHYHGTLVDGKVFDSSVQRGQPAEFALSGVIPCWTEGVQRMQVGEKAKLVCPASIAYGDRGAGTDIPPGATLIFEVELLGIKGK